MRQPPRKLAGQALGARRIDGELLLDVRGAAVFLGLTEKGVRARIARQLLPFRRLGPARIVLVRRELEAFVAALDGVGLEQALANLVARGGRTGVAR